MLNPSRASIMIGAGFSKNADADANFPDWQELGDKFFEKIRGRKPN